MRKTVSKEVRQNVYGKYGHRCAYCGLKIQYENMQISQKVPYYKMENADSYENLLPACRLCNSYKRTLTVDDFRKKIAGFRRELLNNPKYQMLYRFALVPDEEDTNPVFYFEQCAGKEDG